MTDLVNALTRLILQFGVWGVLVALVLFVIFFPEKAERVGGWILSLFSWTGDSIRRRSIIASIQGRVSDFARSLDREAEGSMPYNMRLQFVTQIDRAELDPESDTVIVRIKNRGNADQNLVHAMLAFAPVGCVPQVRPYLRRSLSQAIDVTVTRRLLSSGRHYSALQYLPEAIGGTSNGSELTAYCSTLSELDQRGLFSRVLLAELRDLGALLHTQHPRDEHTEEVSAFLAYVEKVQTENQERHFVNAATAVDTSPQRSSSSVRSTRFLTAEPGRTLITSDRFAITDTKGRTSPRDRGKGQRPANHSAPRWRGGSPCWLTKQT